MQPRGYIRMYKNPARVPWVRNAKWFTGIVTQHYKGNNVARHGRTAFG